jgi:hypothetical protein
MIISSDESSAAYHPVKIYKMNQRMKNTIPSFLREKSLSLRGIAGTNQGPKRIVTIEPAAN